jgi:hypothetical protein
MSLQTLKNPNQKIYADYRSLRRESPSDPFSCAKPEKRGATKIEIRKALYTVPFLWLSGVFTGIAIMLLA